MKLISLRTKDQILISQCSWSYPSKSGMTQETLRPSNPQSLRKLAQREPPAVVEAVGLEMGMGNRRTASSSRALLRLLQRERCSVAHLH